MNFKPLKSSVVYAFLVCGCNQAAPPETPPVARYEFAGSAACQTCHAAEFSDWQGSHHELAMQAAEATTVLGNFSGVDVDYFGTTTRLYKEDDAFLVRTDNARGEQQVFEVTHTFGVEPLQQYLVDMPGGRKQALPFAWDTRPAENGGQRWFHSQADENIAPHDPLHWTGRYYNWNAMCAECHSTNVKVDYDLNTDTFATTYAEVSVGCEACHGPGSRHVEQSRTGRFDETYGLPVDLDDRSNVTWTMNPATGIAERSSPPVLHQQVESCGRCHARRSVLTPDYEYGKPLTDTHMPSLLEEHLYYPDGRILDEVYVYGSFIQSRMYRAGVTCTNCHNPHSGRLVTGAEPNDVCSQCHLPAKFATSEHSGSDVTSCVDCHMPATTYMAVDDRRDHSFRIPGAGEQESHYGAAIAAGRQGSANAKLLLALANPANPAIARATILTLLSSPASEAVGAAVRAGLDDPDPLVRIGALRSLRRQPPELRMQFGSHLLRDTVRGVRIEAALTYADYRDLLPAEDARAYANAANEYREAMLAAGSLPESMTMLAEFESNSGNNDTAEKLFRHAIRLDPAFAAARHAYGLFLVRSGRSDIALEQLQSAATLDPDNARFVYVFGVALNSLNSGVEALNVMRKAGRDFPDDFDIAWALATMLRDRGETAEALTLLDDMARHFPDEARIGALRSALTPEN